MNKKNLFFAAMILCSTAAWSQTDDTSKEVFKKITEALVSGDCDRAQRNYNIWKTLTEQTNPDIEAEIRECSASKKEEAKEFVELKDAGIAVAKKDASSTYVDLATANELCKNSRLGGYANWRLPQKHELYTIYTNKNIIPNLLGMYYWSSTKTGEKTLFTMILTTSKTLEAYDTIHSLLCRCVRTLP